MGIIERKEREKEMRRKDIIDAAEFIFSTKGFENATMQDVATKSELSKGTLYLYFKTKNEICLAIYQRGLEMLYKEMKIELKKTQPTLLKIQNIVEFFINFVRQHPAYYKAILNFRQHGDQCQDDSRFLIACQKMNKQVTNLIKDVIDQGIKKSEIRGDSDSDKISQLIWSHHNGTLSNSILLHDDQLDQTALDNLRYFFKIIINAIKL